MKRIIVAEGAKSQLRIATISEDTIRTAKATPGEYGTISIQSLPWDLDSYVIDRTLMATIVAKLIEAAGSERDDIIGIGMVLSAAVDQQARIAHLTNVGGGVEESYAEAVAELKRQFPGVPVLVDNRSNAGVLAEYLIGWRAMTRANQQDLLLVSFSGNIGAGMVINGKVWRGTRGVAGQIGHLVVDPESERGCLVCNQRGCASELASGRALVRDFLDAAAPEDINIVTRLVNSPNLISDTMDVGFRKVIEFQNGEREINARAVLLAARESRAAATATAQFTRYLAKLVEEIAYVLDPSIVVLGGIATARHELEREVDRLIQLRYAAGGRPLLVSQLGDQAAFYGAALQLVADRETGTDPSGTTAG